jgi:hypothetical protein
MARYGQLSFESFSVPAMLDAFRRLKLANSNGRYPLQSLQDICGLVQEQELAEQQRGFPSMDIRLPNLVEDDEEEDAAEQRLHDELLRGGGNDATPPQT